MVVELDTDKVLELMQQQQEAMKQLFSAKPEDAIIGVQFFRNQAKLVSGDVQAELLVKNLFGMVLSFHAPIDIKRFMDKPGFVLAKQTFGDDGVPVWSDEQVTQWVDTWRQLKKT